MTGEKDFFKFNLKNSKSNQEKYQDYLDYVFEIKRITLINKCI